MSNRSYCGPNKFPQNYRSNASNNEYDRYKLPAINNGPVAISNMNSAIGKPPLARPCIPQANENYPNLNNGDANNGNTNNPSPPVDCVPSGPAMHNARTPSYNNSKVNCPPRGVASSQTFTSPPSTSGMGNDIQQEPTNRGWSSHQFTGFDKTNTDVNKNLLTNQSNNYPQRPMTSVPGGFNSSRSNMNICNGQKNVVRDRNLANEILQKAGIASNLTSNDCLEVITDTPVMMNDNVNCDPNPLCLKKPANCQVIFSC
jgi:hypothetical protein